MDPFWNFREKLSINTKRLLLRPIAEIDVPYIREWLQDNCLYQYWSSKERSEQIIDIDFFKEDDVFKSFHWGIQFEGNVVGELWTFIEKNKNSAKIAYRISAEYWGRGIASESVCAVVEICFNNFDVRRVWADVFTENMASVRVLEKNGFHQTKVIRVNEAKFDCKKEYYIYELYNEQS